MVTLADRQYTLTDFQLFSDHLVHSLPEAIQTQIRFLANSNKLKNLDLSRTRILLKVAAKWCENHHRLK